MAVHADSSAETFRQMVPDFQPTRFLFRRPIVDSLKPLNATSIPTCLEKARHYRLLNDPENAESICLDIIELQPDHQEALKTLVLAISDQFDGGTRKMRQAKQFLDRLTSEYDQRYHTGLVLERAARAALNRKTPDCAFAAYDWLQQAKEQYEKSESLSAEDNDDAVLRWNACTRTIANRKLKARPADSYMQPYGDS